MGVHLGEAPLALYVSPFAVAAAGEAAVTPWLAGQDAAAVDEPGDLAAVGPGDLVTCTATARGNPMGPLLELMAATLPLVAPDPAPPPRRPSAARGGQSPFAPAAGPDATTPEEQRLLVGVVTAGRDGLRDSPLVDLAFATGGGVPVVASLTRSALDPAAEALLASGTYRIVGKVAQVVPEGSQVSLLRRSVLSAVGTTSARELLADLDGVFADLPDPLVEGPALDLVPLVIVL